MTLNGHFALNSVSGSAPGWRLRLSHKTVRKLAELPINCQQQKCSPGNVVYGSIRLRWRGGVKWEWGRRKWWFSVHSVTVFWTFYIRDHWPHDSFQVIRLSMTLGIFQGHWTVSHQISQNGVWYGKCYYRQLIGNHTLAFDWSYFWWPWSTCEGHFSLGCHFHVHFSNLWHVFASHSLPAIAELLVVFDAQCVSPTCHLEIFEWRYLPTDSLHVWF